MKKVILVLALALMAFTANAQVYIGGSIGFQAAGGTAVVNLAPEVGYNLNDDMSIGGVIGWRNTVGSTFTLAPYFRYFLADLGPVRFFCDALLELDIYSNSGQTTTSFGVGVAPGMALPLGDHLSLVGRLGRMGYFNGGFALQVAPDMAGSSLGLYYAF